MPARLLRCLPRSCPGVCLLWYPEEQQKGLCLGNEPPWGGPSLAFLVANAIEQV